jgi:hypothetical protein
MNDPSPWDKFLYIAGKRAAPQHHAWLNSFLRDTEPHKLGAILSIPNSLIVVAFGLLALTIGDPGFTMFAILGAAAIPVAGAFVPAIRRGRVTRIDRKNSLSASDSL